MIRTLGKQKPGFVMISLGGAGHKMWQRLTNVEQRFDNYYMLDASECNPEIYDLSAFDGPANELVRFHVGSFETCMQQLYRILEVEADHVFLVGLGGRTGTSMFLQIIDNFNLKNLTFICFLPFKFEGRERNEMAQKAVDRAISKGANVLVYSNQDLFAGAHSKEKFTEAFQRQAEYICSMLFP